MCTSASISWFVQFSYFSKEIFCIICCTREYLFSFPSNNLKTDEILRIHPIYLRGYVQKDFQTQKMYLTSKLNVNGSERRSNGMGTTSMERDINENRNYHYSHSFDSSTSINHTYHGDIDSNELNVFDSKYIGSVNGFEYHFNGTKKGGISRYLAREYCPWFNTQSGQTEEVRFCLCVSAFTQDEWPCHGIENERQLMFLAWHIASVRSLGSTGIDKW